MRRKVKVRKVPDSPKTSTSSADDVPPLSRAQIRQLQRQVRDLDDRTRYLLVSVFTKKFALYYDVSRDVYTMNDASAGTLFKRRTAAQAIGHLLSDGVQIVRCRVDRQNRPIKSSVPRLGPLWRRRLRSRRAPQRP